MIRAIGEANFNTLRAQISESIASGVLDEIIENRNADGSYSLPSDSDFIAREISVFVEILKLPRSAYPGLDLLDYYREDGFVEGFFELAGQAATMMLAASRQLDFTYFKVNGQWITGQEAEALGYTVISDWGPTPTGFKTVYAIVLGSNGPIFGEAGFVYRGQRFGQSDLTEIDGVYFANVDGLGFVPVGLTNEKILAIVDSLSLPQHCFAANTAIRLADDSSANIQDIVVGAEVAAYDTQVFYFRSPTVPARVTRLFTNVTEEWLIVRPAFGFEAVAKRLGFSELTVTPGHLMLDRFGQFRKAIEILDGDAFLMLADGSSVSAEYERVVYSAETAHLYEQAEVLFCGNNGGLALQPEVRRGWKTYNFEVESYHTYIAGGVRVHNDSLFYPQTAAGQLADEIADMISDAVFADNPWQNILIGSALRSFGSVAADSLFGDETFSGELLLGRYALNVIDSLGGFAGRALMTAALDGVDIDPALANALSLFADQAGSQLAQLAAMEFLQANADGVLANEATQAIDNLQNGLDFGTIIRSAGFAALGSYAGSQLAELLDVNSEYAQLITAPVQIVITTIGNNLIAHTDWFAGLDANLLKGLGSIAGTLLANEIGNFDTYTEQIGSQIGAKIGAFVFGFLGPIGSFVGSLIGGLLGGLIGGLFGDDPEGFADISFSTLDDLFSVSRIYGEDKNHKTIAAEMADAHISALSSILELLDADIISPLIPTVTYGSIESSFTVTIGGQSTYSGSDAEAAINTGIYETISAMDFAGGDIYARRAIHAVAEQFGAGGGDRSEALNELMTALMLAKEFKNYLDKTAEINALIAADPNTEFAMGWQVTLAQVFALGLQQRSEVDWNGGWKWWLNEQSASATTVYFSHLGGDRSFVLTNGLTTTVLADTIVPGQKDVVSGGDGSDYIFLQDKSFDGNASQSGTPLEFIGFDGFDRAGTTTIGFAARINGGAGDDQIYGGDLGNDLFGGTGNDYLIGGKLDDWLFGGDGNDILVASGGLGDMLDGGAGNDTLLGDNSEDWMIGGAGDDVLRGFDGMDVLEGGAGRDLLQGGEGGDIYIFRSDSGIDIISDAGKNGTDVIAFGAGISASDLVVRRADNGDDLIIRINGNATAMLVITGALLTNVSGIERFEFSDGTVWTRSQIVAAISGTGIAGSTFTGDASATTLTGTLGGDDIASGAGDDIMQDGAGSDIYRFNLGDGADTVIDAGTNRDIDRVVFGVGITAANLRLVRSAADSDLLTIEIIGTTDKVSIRYGESAFGDGVEFFEFADGTVLSYLDLNKTYITQNQTSGDNVLVGGAGNEILSGGLGNDTLRGGGGIDKLDGDRGNDTYIYQKGDGLVSISEYDGTDKLIFGANIGVNDIRISVGARSSSSIVIDFLNAGDRIELLSQNGGNSIETFEFHDGTIWTYAQLIAAMNARDEHRNKDVITGAAIADNLRGGAGDDRLSGNSGTDTLTGGAGDDILLGGGNDDTYVYNLGDGSDVISEFTNGGANDKLVLGAGISARQLDLQPGPEFGRQRLDHICRRRARGFAGPWRSLLQWRR